METGVPLAGSLPTGVSLTASLLSPLLRCRNDPLLQGDGGSFCPVANLQFRCNVIDMVTNCILADLQDTPNLLIG